MNKELHARAEELIAQERVEGISTADQLWLRQHLADCAGCAARAGATEQAIRSLRGISVSLPKTLANRTHAYAAIAWRAALAHGLRGMWNFLGLWRSYRSLRLACP